MKTIKQSFVQRALKDQRGQVLPLVALGMVLFVGMTGLTIDVGHAYIVRGQLQGSVDAAALAASGYVYDTSTAANATTVASQYVNLNNFTGLVQRSGYPAVTTPCLNMLMPSGSPACTNTNGNASGTSVANAVRVTEQVLVPTYFMGILGSSFKTLTVGTSATASMGAAQKWNVAIIVDGTASMADAPDANCTSAGYTTRFACALGGIKSLLTLTNPCMPGQAPPCSVANSNLRIALFMFPNQKSSVINLTSGCSSTYTKEPYTFPTATPTASAGYVQVGTTKSTYQITAFDSTFYEPGSGGTKGLNTSDNLVKVTGAGGSSACISDAGGESTYYAGAIYAATAALLNEQTSYSGSKNAIVLLSDGQAVAGTADMDSSESGFNTTGIYPSGVDECQQAIVAANYAANHGIDRVYGVAFGSESSGCYISSNPGTNSSNGPTDYTTLAAVKALTTLNVPITAISSTAMTPCVTIEDVASSLSYFYADSSSASTGCTDNAHTTQSVGNIFDAISSSLSNMRLLPNNAT
jgi:Flp pilus assembly protein TadG